MQFIFFFNSLFHLVLEGIGEIFFPLCLFLYDKAVLPDSTFSGWDFPGTSSVMVPRPRSHPRVWWSPQRGWERCRSLESACLPAMVGAACLCARGALAIPPLCACRLLFSAVIIDEVCHVTHLRFGLRSLCVLTWGFKWVLLFNGQLNLPLPVSTLLWIEVG